MGGVVVTLAKFQDLESVREKCDFVVEIVAKRKVGEVGRERGDRAIKRVR